MIGVVWLALGLDPVHPVLAMAVVTLAAVCFYAVAHLLRAALGIPPLPLRSVGSGGESLGAAMLDWGREALGLTINEFYGQTECNMIVSSCARLMPARPGIMDRAAPGHRLAWCSSPMILALPVICATKLPSCIWGASWKPGRQMPF